MSDLTDFQKQHGASWATIVQSPAFGAAFSIANIEKLQMVAALTDEEINTNGKIILADLRGHLKYETALISLHERKEFVFQEMPRETYPDPVKEAEEAEREENQTTTGNDATSFNLGEFQTAEAEPEPKPKTKRKYTRRKKK